MTWNEAELWIALGKLAKLLGEMVLMMAITLLCLHWILGTWWQAAVVYFLALILMQLWSERRKRLQ